MYLFQYVKIFFSQMAEYCNQPTNSSKLQITLRWLLQWGSPLSIPNREVKPISADGTTLVEE